MTHFDPTPTDTLLDARNRYFAVNGFGPTGGYEDKWVDFKLGPIPMPFPNTKSRIRAVRFHDLHHVLTGYDTDIYGEFEISAWEIGSGCADHVAAWQLNLGGLFAGAIVAPRRTWRAFVRGRHSRNLYRHEYGDALLTRHVDEMKRELELDRSHSATASDAALYAAALAAGFVVGGLFAVFAIPASLVGNVAALVARKRPANTTA
jgi:hypothetical protein